MEPRGHDGYVYARDAAGLVHAWVMRVTAALLDRVGVSQNACSFRCIWLRPTPLSGSWESWYLVLRPWQCCDTRCLL